MMTSIFKLLVLVPAAVIGTAALAQTGSSQPAADQIIKSVEVSYAGVDLGSSAGQKAMMRRINAAANSACGVDQSERNQHVRQEANRCHDAAVSDARITLAAITSAPLLASR